ncbi:MAG: S9 family peptidase [Planctomycetes bacterium]|nr:S9 family peptidase [Planctomycetota bacterium]
MSLQQNLRSVGLVGMASLILAFAAGAQAPTRVSGANWKQAYKYSDAFLKQATYSLSVEPQWIGKTDNFWYEYRTSAGKVWHKVTPSQAKKEPLFDRVKLAAQLSEEVRKPLDPLQLPVTRGSVSEGGVKFKFVTENLQFEYDLRTEKLVKLGKAPPLATGFGGMSPDQLQRMREILGEERFKEMLDQQKKNTSEKKDDESFDDGILGEDERLFLQDEMRRLERDHRADHEDADDESGPQKAKGKGGFKGGGAFGDYRNFSPDKSMYAFVKNHNLFIAEAGKEEQAKQLTKDGAEDYTFVVTFGGFGGQQFQKKDDKDKEKTTEGKSSTPDKEKKSRAPVTWSKDSKAFYVVRRDTRGIKDLYLVNSLSEPRPTLMKYPYPMPGEDNVRKSELYVFNRDKDALVKIERKWKDESYSDLHWDKSNDKLRFLRTDRVVRNIEFCSYDVAKAEAKCLIGEGFENSSISVQAMRYLDESNEMIWWSERSGWGHFYLYERSGKLKNAITAGDFRASTIVAVDAKQRQIYIRGNARERGENVYQTHLYRVNLDGSGLTLLDPGNADHDSRLSPSRQVIVDNCSRVDMPPVSILRDAQGEKIMELETADVSKLNAIGWKMPQPFTVKAADGVTDLYGNIYKPFDFDSSKKYPIIAHVYPGPQTESTPHSFRVSSPQQQLAQLGFIVIQVGNRGGTPLRSKPYQNYSYWNLRDYGLADKKFAIEQLAARHAWIDIERVGIYGHSGGGFMSAAAMLVKPYNDFFKVAVASAGNHDNNVYNNTWSERYHGMKEIPAASKEDPKTPPKAKVKLMPAADEEPTTDKKDVAKKEEKKDDAKPATRWDIKVPTNAELAANLTGRLLLVHGDMDNNVHHAGTMRLADALIKANKRFDMFLIPGKAHGFGTYQPYFTQRLWEYFAEHLLDDRPRGADLYERREKK